MATSTKASTGRQLRARPQTPIQYFQAEADDNDEQRSAHAEESDNHQQQQRLATGPALVQLRNAPIKQLTDYKAIYEFLRSKIKDQDAPIQSIAMVLDDVIVRDYSIYGPDKPLIFKFTIAGTSGSGKTETVHWITHIMGMAQGYEYQNQFISIDASVMADDQQVSAVTGAAPGLVGHDEEKSLAHRLNRALRLYVGPRLRAILAKKTTNPVQYKRELLAYKSEPLETPPYLFVFIDEIDKASPMFMRAINGFLDTANYCTPDGSEDFVLPRGVKLLIIFTCNYGDTMIARMGGRRNKDEAEQYALDAMREHGLGDNNIERLGTIYIFFPLERDSLKAILAERLDECIRNTPIAKQYGEDRIVYSDEVKNELLDKILDMTDTGRGVRNGLRVLFDNVNTLFKTALHALNKMLRNKTLPASALIEEKIVITADEIDMALFRQSLEDECQAFVKDVLYKDIVLALLDDPQCLTTLREHGHDPYKVYMSTNNNSNSNNNNQLQKREGPRIDTMSMFIGNRHVASCSFGVTNVTLHHNTTNIYINSSSEAKRLREENQGLRQTLSHIVDLIDDEENGDPHEFYKKVKRVTSERRDLLVPDYTTRALLTHASQSEEEEMEEEKEQTEEEELSFHHQRNYRKDKSKRSHNTHKKKKVKKRERTKKTRRRSHEKKRICDNSSSSCSSDDEEDDEESDARVTEVVDAPSRATRKRARQLESKEQFVPSKRHNHRPANSPTASSDQDTDDSGPSYRNNDNNNNNNKKVGRPRKELYGFVFHDILNRNKRYKCLSCLRIIFSKYASTHSCNTRDLK